MGRKFLLILSTITNFDNIPLFSTKLLIIKICPEALHNDLYIIIKIRCRLLLPPSRSGQWETWNRKQILPNSKRHYSSPTVLYQSLLSQAQFLPYKSVQDTRTAFTFSFSLTWKRKSKGKFVLSNITFALLTGELLSWRLYRFVPDKESYYKLTKVLCGPQNTSGGDRRSLTYRNSK